jgi:hypothetical protein
MHLTSAERRILKKLTVWTTGPNSLCKEREALKTSECLISFCEVVTLRKLKAVSVRWKNKLL